MSVTEAVATTPRAAPRRLGNWGHRNARWLFPAPAVLLVAAIIVYPIVYTVWMSLQDWFASSLTLPKFIGLANYQKILVGDPRFREAVVRTLYFTALVIAGETVLGVAMALLFNREFWGRGLLRTLAILPMVATPVAIGLVFVMMYHPTLGVANYLVSLTGLAPFKWTYSSGTALYALAVVDIWQWTPLIMLIALAGLASLPQEPYEAAPHRRRHHAAGVLAHHAAAAPADRHRRGPVPGHRRDQDLRHHLHHDPGRPGQLLGDHQHPAVQPGLLLLQHGLRARPWRWRCSRS